MKALGKIFTSAALSVTIMTTAIAGSFSGGIADAEETYLVRDPFYNYNSGYNYYESEHFQFIWGNSGDSSKVTQEFLSGNAQNMENCWNVYMKDLDMAAPSESTDPSLRDGKQYKTNIYISGTGLSGMDDDWAYMSYDSGGYAYMFCCVDAMQYDPPSWVLPHEFGHVVTAHQLGWNNNKYSYAWWESMGNWYREQYLYSDYSNDETGYGTDFFETYLKNLNFTFPCGRDYYAAWPFLQYLTENPDGMDGYGSDFVKKMLQEGQVDEYPFDIVDRLAPADIKDTLGNFAKHMAALDFKNGDAYRARLNELFSAGSWNRQQIYTMLEPVAGEENTYQVPTERAPQHAGMNIVPLNVTGDKITVKLNGLTNIEGADWRACIVQRLNDGSCRYSELFSDGDTCVAAVEASLESAYLSVIATPDNDTYTKAGLPYGPDSEFAESNYPFTSKQQYPYSVVITGADIAEREVSTSQNWWEKYHNHSNGGGLVSDNATVDDSVYVAPDAKVLGNAKVTGNVRIEDHAVVQDNAVVSDNAVIGGYAIIAENADISGNARVDDTALVMGRAKVSGSAKVIESACVYGTYTMTDNACAKGVAFCMTNGSISGQGAVDGDYYDDGGKTVSKGTAYGWVSPQSYVDDLSYTDKLMYAYDFSDNSSLSFKDRYTSTYGTASGNLLWEKTRTSADGVLTFNGKGEYAQLDRSMLYTKDFDLQTAFLARAEGEQTLIHLGNDKAYIKLSALNDDGFTEAVFSDGTTVQKLVSDVPVNLGEWTSVRLILDGDKGELIINGKTAASADITIDPEDIASAVKASDKTAAYRMGADNKGENCLNGSVDYVHLYNSRTSDPANVTYTEKEDITSDKTIIGDVDFNGSINIFDLAILKETFSGKTAPTGRLAAASDLNGDGKLSVEDISLVQSYIGGIIEGFPAGEYGEY